jgi:hypothetical protein
MCIFNCCAQALPDNLKFYIMTQTAFSNFYKIAMLCLTFIIAIALSIVAIKDQPGRYIKYGKGDLILDTKDAKVYVYDLSTMTLKPHHLETVSW